MFIKKTNLCIFFGIICLIIAYPSFGVEDDDASDTTSVAVTEQSQDVIGNVLLQSMSLIGIPYHWGGNTPQQGMDCSGFIRYVFKKALGITLPRTAADMARIGIRIEVAELEPGDLIFFRIHHRYIDHVGMYIGNNKFIQSPHTGDSIKISELNSAWRSNIAGAKRIVQEDIDDNNVVTIENYQDIHDEALPVRSGYTKRVLHNNSHGKNAKHMSTRTYSTRHSIAKPKRKKKHKQ